MIEFGNVAHGHAVAQAAGGKFSPDVASVISRSERGVLLGGIVYEGYTGASVCMHVASFAPLWVNRDLLWVSFDYPFTQMGCKLVLGEVASTNPKALAFDLNLGFKLEATIRDAVPGGDLLILTMRRDDCRWLKIKPRTLQRGCSSVKTGRSTAPRLQ